MNMSSLAKQTKKGLRTVMKETMSDVDIELKAILYDISKGQQQMRDGIIASIERVRRKLLVLDKKSEIYFKEVEKDLSKLRCLENVEITLKAENRSLRDKLLLLNKQLLDLTGEETFDCIPLASTSESENSKTDCYSQELMYMYDASSQACTPKDESFSQALMDVHFQKQGI